MSETLQRFLNACEDTGTTIWITDGAVGKIEPDGTGRLVADIVSSVYQNERRQLIRRVQAGVERARREGKWLGRVPAGFERTDDGRIRPLLDSGDGEDGFLEIQAAVRELDRGASFRATAEGLSITRQGLAGLFKNDERRAWYLDAEADDDRVSDALREVQDTVPGDGGRSDSGGLSRVWTDV